MKVTYAVVGLIGLSLVAAGCAQKPADKMMDNKDGAMMQDKGMMGDDKMMDKKTDDKMMMDNKDGKMMDGKMMDNKDGSMSGDKMMQK